MTDNFVKTVSDYLKAEREKRNLDTQKSVIDENIRKSNAPHKWSQLRTWVKEFCEKANLEMGEKSFRIDDTTNNMLHIYLERPGTERSFLGAEFDQVGNVIRFQSNNERGIFQPGVVDGRFTFLNGREPVSVEQMGKTLIGLLMGWRGRFLEANLS